MTEQRNTLLSPSFSKKLANLGFNRGIFFTLIILTALLAFESFNFSTTNYALADLLGNLTFGSISWATILSIAFCGIDFAGIARLFTSDRKAAEANEVWYLFAAWMLAATMNAILTWWAVSLALENHTLRSTTVLDQNTLIKAVPIFVALMVWLIRILIIGSLSMAGDRLLSHEARRYSNAGYPESIKTYTPHPSTLRSSAPSMPANTAGQSTSPMQAAPRPAARQEIATPRQAIPVRNNEPVYTHVETKRTPVETPASRPDPVYQPLAAGANPASHQTRLM
jgi:hypothetical protein